jgi:hypothetical protein
MKKAKQGKVAASDEYQSFEKLAKALIGSEK